MGTIVEQVKEQKMKADIIIASGDMDTMQLIDDDRVRVYTLKKGIKDTIIYNEKAVMERFGFGPNSFLITKVCAAIRPIISSASKVSAKKRRRN